jgi:putative nucleotidyltransferase with HDIG domain
MSDHIWEIALAIENDRVVCSESGGLRAVDFLEVLAETIEAKDPYMSGHSRRVSFYANQLAERVGVSDHDLELVRVGAFLHDLGKVGVPTELLQREGALDPGERRIVEQHPVIGARLVRPLGLHADLVGAIRHHHEWWNGTGYPDALSREKIPYAARIVSIADAFDAMSSDRPYRAALRREAVLDELTRCAGIQFDPELAVEFVALLDSHADEVDITLLADPSARIATSVAPFATF